MTDLFEKKPDAPLVTARQIMLADAKAAHTAGLGDGIECALCGRFDKIYKRKLNSGMARIVILLYKQDRKSPFGWVHILNTFGVSGGDYGKVVEWKLIEKAEGHKDDGNPDNGHYRITTRGKLFCEGKLSVPKYLYFYHDRLWPVQDDEETTIQQALGTKFNWNELMAETI